MFFNRIGMLLLLMIMVSSVFILVISIKIWGNKGQDVLIPMELVDYVGLEKVTEWILIEKKANIIQFKFDVNEFREYFHITDDKFTELIETNNLEDMYDVKEIINEKSIL